MRVSAVGRRTLGLHRSRPARQHIDASPRPTLTGARGVPAYATRWGGAFAMGAYASALDVQGDVQHASRHPSDAPPCIAGTTRGRRCVIAPSARQAPCPNRGPFRCGRACQAWPTWPSRGVRRACRELRGGRADAPAASSLLHHAVLAVFRAARGPAPAALLSPAGGAFPVVVRTDAAAS